MSAAPAREPAARSKGDATRGRIVAEARRTLIEEGYDALALRGVASRLDMRVGNLQYYFASRDELLLAVIRADAEGDVEALRAALERAESPEAGLDTLVETLVRRWRGEGGLVFVPLQLLAKHKPAFREAYREIYEAFYAEVEGVLEALEPGIQPAECATRARLLTALLDGAAMQIRVGPKRGFLAALTRSALAIAGPGAPR